MLCDVHTHSIYSFDGNETIDDMCAMAIERGLGVLAITDHAEAMEGVAYDATERERIEKQYADIISARDKFGSKLQILFGCELGQPHLNEEYAKSVLNDFEFDFVLGSLHFFRGNLDLYDVTYTSENFVSRMNEYFNDVKDMIAVGGFHSLGHLDYIMRRMQACFDGKPTYRAFEAHVDEILDMLVARDMGLEINTSSLRNWMAEFSMEKWVLSRFREKGGRYVTIGSDAHYKKDIGCGISQAIELLKNAGFSHYNYYKKGEPISVSI